MAFKMIFELLLLLYIEAVYRRCSEGKSVFRNFAKFTRKRLCQSLFFNKVAGLRPAALLKKRLALAQMFSSEFCEISKDTFSYRTPPVAASVFMVHIHKECFC